MYTLCQFDLCLMWDAASLNQSNALVGADKKSYSELPCLPHSHVR